MNNKLILFLKIVFISLLTFMLFMLFMTISKFVSLYGVYYVLILSFFTVISVITIIDLLNNSNEVAKIEKEHYISELKNSLLNETTEGKSNAFNDETTSIKESGDSILPFKENKDILQLMIENMGSINEYYSLSKAQAQKSFQLATFTSIFGIVLVAASVISIYVTPTSLSTALIPAISGALVEVIAGTALLVYKNSIEQMNKYYNSLHNNERFLSNVHLVSKLSPIRQDEVYIEIIRNGFEKSDAKGI